MEVEISTAVAVVQVLNVARLDGIRTCLIMTSKAIRSCTMSIRGRIVGIDTATANLIWTRGHFRGRCGYVSNHIVITAPATLAPVASPAKSAIMQPRPCLLEVAASLHLTPAVDGGENY